jgi:hypothetical protein
VTQLRQKMLEELQHNSSHRTAKTYVRIVRDFAEYFHQPPDTLGPEQIRQYLPNRPTMLLSTARASAPRVVVSPLAAIHLNPPLTFLNHPPLIVALQLSKLRLIRLTTSPHPPARRTSRESRIQNP